MPISIETIVFILLLFLSTRKYRTNVYFRYLPYLIIFIFMVIRYDFGDGVVYRFIFNNIHNGIKMSGIEPLYILLNKLLPSFFSVIFVTSSLYVFVFYYVISNVLTFKERELSLIILALHPYILMVDMSAMRQSIAIVLVFLGVYIGNEYKSIYYIPFCFLATLFHKSAIILLPITFMFNKRHFSKKTKFLILGSTLFFLISSHKLFRLVEFVLSIVNLNTANYLSYLYNGNTNSLYAVVFSFMVLIFFMICGNAVHENNAIYIKLSIFAMIFELLQGNIQQFGRIEMYFLPFLVLSIPLIIKNSLQTLEIDLIITTIKLKKYYCWIVEICLLTVFLLKLINFTTPYFVYQSLFTVG